MCTFTMLFLPSEISKRLVCAAEPSRQRGKENHESDRPGDALTVRPTSTFYGSPFATWVSRLTDSSFQEGGGKKLDRGSGYRRRGGANVASEVVPCGERRAAQLARDARRSRVASRRGPAELLRLYKQSRSKARGGSRGEGGRGRERRGPLAPHQSPVRAGPCRARAAPSARCAVRPHQPRKCATSPSGPARAITASPGRARLPGPPGSSSRLAQVTDVRRRIQLGRLSPST